MHRGELEISRLILKISKRNKKLLSQINEDYQSIVNDLFHVFSAIYYLKVLNH